MVKTKLRCTRNKKKFGQNPNQKQELKKLKLCIIVLFKKKKSLASKIFNKRKIKTTHCQPKL